MAAAVAVAAAVALMVPESCGRQVIIVMALEAHVHVASEALVVPMLPLNQGLALRENSEMDVIVRSSL